MELKSVVLKAFNDVLLTTPMNSELKRAIVESARVRGVVDNIYRELLAAEAHRQQRNGRATKPHIVKQTAEDLFKLFVQGLTREIDKRQQSDISRLMEEQKQQQALDLELTATGTPSGDYQELVERGLKIGDTLVDEVQ